MFFPLTIKVSSNMTLIIRVCHSFYFTARESNPNPAKVQCLMISTFALL
ncbi:hypothetical protein GXM_02100 [Nostoc sphaeroides CCNUC1]|uniref:Uncharacterized protein n=1 Tax=Nostoc sphaeroides CCNUC1 TaxID=2653204 RepID=A0A5P8VW44_9NOSO|nr:hypothetical protein GXM_02100 [Nostoc sphaeroides CCNUC1]